MTHQDLIHQCERDLAEARQEFEDIKGRAIEKSKQVHDSYVAGNTELARKLGWELANLGSDVYTARNAVERAAITLNGFRERGKS